MIRIVHPPWIGYGPYHLALDRGLFRSHNLEVELEVTSPASAVAAFDEDRAGGLGTLLDREIARTGRPGKVVLALVESSGWDGIVAGPGIVMVPDLAGKLLAVDRNSAGYFLLLSLLEKGGIREGDLKIREHSPDDAAAAFLAGEVDAAVTWQPWLERAGERPGGHLLADSRNLPRTIVDVLVLAEELMAQQPEAGARLARTWFAALALYRQDPAGSLAVMARGLDLPLEQAQEMARGVLFFDDRKNLAFFDRGLPGNIWEVAERAGRFWLERGRIDRLPENPISDRFVRTAAR